MEMVRRLAHTHLLFWVLIARCVQGNFLLEDEHSVMS